MEATAPSSDGILGNETIPPLPAGSKQGERVTKPLPTGSTDLLRITKGASLVH